MENKNPLETQLDQWIEDNSYQKLLISSRYQPNIEPSQEYFTLQQSPESSTPSSITLDELPEYQNQFDALILDHSQLKFPNRELPPLLDTLSSEGHLLLTMANTQYFRFIQDYYKNGLSQTYYLQGDIPSLQYNLDFLRHFLKQSGYGIQSMMALADQQFFDLYPEFTQEENISINIDNTASVTISSPLELLKYLSCYFALLIAPLHTIVSKTQIRFTPYSIEDIQSLLYEDPTKYWKEFGHYYASHELLFEEERIRVESEAKYFAKEIENLNLNPDSILEVGCAYGRNLKALRQLFPTSKLSGIDINSEQLNQARNYLGDQSIQLILSEANQPLPFEDNEFDLVFTSGVLCILPESMARYLSEEIARISKHLIIHNESIQPEDYRFYSHPIETFYDLNTLNLIQVADSYYAGFKYWVFKK